MEIAVKTESSIIALPKQLLLQFAQYKELFAYVSRNSETSMSVTVLFPIVVECRQECSSKIWKRNRRQNMGL